MIDNILRKIKTCYIYKLETVFCSKIICNVIKTKIYILNDAHSFERIRFCDRIERFESHNRKTLNLYQINLINDK